MRCSIDDLKPLFLALNLNPDNPLLQQRLADHLFSSDFNGDAVEYYCNAIKKNADCIWNRVYLAKAFFYSGRFREMEVLLDYIFELDTFPPLTYILRAHLFCVNNQYTLAEESYLKAVKLNKLIQDKWLENQLWGLKYDHLQMAK